MDLPPLPQLDITFDKENANESIMKILKEIRPQWKPDDVKVKVMSEGLVNMLYRCTHGDDVEDRLMVRKIGENDGLANCYNRDSEIGVLRVLDKENLNTPIVCRFNNGFVYGFANGDTLTRQDLHDESIRKKIIELQHRIHQTDFCGYLGEVPRPGILIFMDNPWDTIDATDFSQIQKDPRYTAGLPPLDELRKYREEMRSLYSELCEIYPVVYCHGDCHIHNIVYNKSKGKMTFLDWEDSNWCPEIFDPTTLFDRNLEGSDVFMAPEDRRLLLKDYLSLHPTLGKEPITEELLNKWYRDSLRTSLITSFIAVSFCIVSIKTSDKEDTDFYEMGSSFYKCFKDYLEEMNNLDAKTKN